LIELKFKQVKSMLWIYIIIGIVVVIGLVYWFKSGKKGDGGSEMPTPPQTPPETPSSTGPTETPESPSSEEERPM